MALKKITLSVPAGRRPVDPMEIFGRLTLRGSVKNIWEPQADALKQWHRARGEVDVMVRLNTGGGKTLVGLLMAQSLANESRGQILYVCPNNQLVEQTAAKAREIGLSPALRYAGNWTSRDAFDSGDVFCITNYATVFNGKSIFANSSVQGLIFDDAHVAEDIIRGAFTLVIPRNHGAHGRILELFRKHFTNSSQADRFRDVSDGRRVPVLFVPMFAVWSHADEIRRILLETGVEKDEDNLFAWQHLRDHLKHCAVLADRNGIEITPAVLPLSQMSFFATGVRRIYLSATLPSQASFARTFGIMTPTIIEPAGKSGNAQRLFVFVTGGDDDAQRAHAQSLLQDRKCCVISPSRRKAEEWVPPSKIFDKDDGQVEIDKFARSSESQMLGLVARYDGIDLPGDACRIVVLDRPPKGENLFDRFIDESIRVEAVRVSHTAARIVQAIGRIFRSNTDHGVVLLVGPDLQSWLRKPKYAQYLTPLLQQQLLFAAELAKKVESGEMAWSDLIDAILNGDENWDTLYNEYVEQFETQVVLPDVGWYVTLVRREHSAYGQLWAGQHRASAGAYSELAEDAAGHDNRLAAWYRHWRGLALMCDNDRHSAMQDFLHAADIRAELGRPDGARDAAFRLTTSEDTGPQAKRLAAWYRKNSSRFHAIQRQIDHDLVYGPSTGKTEEALCQLGTLLGLEASRPDKSQGTGPDVLWLCDGASKVWGFELKTNKDVESEYSKAEIAQCHDHENFLTGRYVGAIQLAIVGPMLMVSDKAHPSTELRIIELLPFRGLFDRVKAVFSSVDAGDKSNLECAFESWLRHYGLLWPTCIEALESTLAVDLRR